METPIPRILLALDGKIDFMCKNNGVEPEAEKPSADVVADKLRTAFANWTPSRRG